MNEAPTNSRGGSSSGIGERPGPSFRDGRLNDQFVVPCRMGHHEFSCEEGDLLLRHGGEGSVAEVPDYGTAYVRHLEAYLMVSPRLELNLNEGSSSDAFQHPIGEPCLLACGCGDWDDPAGFPLSSFHVMHQSAGRFLRSSFHHRKICLLYGVRAELSAHAFGCLGCSAQEKHSGHGAIQPMNKAEKDPARLAVSFLEPCLPQIEKGYLPGFVSLNQKPRWFI